MKYDFDKRQIVYSYQREFKQQKPALLIEFPDAPAGDILIANEPVLRGKQWVLTYTVYAKGSPEWQAEMDKRA